MASREISDKIEAVLNECMPSLEGYEDGDLLIEWVVVAYTAHPDEEVGGSYPMFYSNGLMPTHRVRGLLETGRLLLDRDTE